MNVSKQHQELHKNNKNTVSTKIILVICLLFSTLTFSQRVSEELKSAIKADDLESFKTLIDVTDLEILIIK